MNIMFNNEIVSRTENYVSFAKDCFLSLSVSDPLAAGTSPAV
jgi:hypothetical protein